MSYKEQYDTRKASVLKLLSKTSNYYREVNEIESEQVFEDLNRQVESGEFSIVVVGEFSAGKSTFLNALMGEKYLPSFSGETTATVNFLKHKAKAEASEGMRVIYNDRSSQDFAEASFDNVEKFSTTKGEDVASSIQQVDLFLESDFLNNDVILVDSPGLNGVREGHRKITEVQIKKSHACIFLFNAEQPGKNSDFEFLNHLRNEVSTIILVLNKIDTINTNEESIESVLQVLANGYQSKFPDAESVPEIWAISAQDALIARSNKKIVEQDYTDEQKPILLEKSRMVGFEHRLWRFLTQGEKARAELLSPVEAVMSTLNNSKKKNDQLILELQDTQSKGDVLIQIDALESQLETLAETVENNKRNIKRQIRQSRLAAENTMTTNLESIRERYITKFNDDFIKDHDRLLMDDDIETTLKRFVLRLEEDVNNSLISFSHSFQSELESNIQSIVDIELDGMNEELAKLSQPIELGKKDEIGQYNLSLDYSQIEKRRNDFESEIEKLEDRLNASELEEKTAIKLAHQKASLEERKRTLIEQKNDTIAGMGGAPTAERFTEENTTKEQRGGVGGYFLGVLIGDKVVHSTDTIVDDTRVKNFEKHKQTLSKEFDTQINDVMKELNSLKEVDFDKSHLNVRELNKKLTSLEEKKIQETKEFKQNQSRYFKAQLKKMQEEIEDKIDSTRREALDQVSNRLRTQEKALIPILSKSLENSLSDKLLRKKQELELKKMDLEGSITEKEQLIESCEKQASKIIEILTDAIDLQCELEEQNIDVIEQQNIANIAVGE